jgi:dTDP-4-dehydrorhamnose reductase
MKILLLGADGQLGRRLRERLGPQVQLVALGRSGDGTLCGDLADAAGLAATVRSVHPDVIVNAAAYTAVDRAETERDQAFAVNAIACGVLAREAKAIGAWLVHYSTDYVFDGSGEQPWRENDRAAPLNTYGQSKLAGEEAIAAEGGTAIVLRTSWVFDSAGHNFLTAILDAARTRESLRVVDDQWGAPTSARLLADATALLLDGLHPARAGLYHFAAAGATSRLAFAKFVLDCARGHGMPLRTGPDAIHAVTTGEMPTPARRPLNSRLDTRRFSDTFGIAPAPWEQGVREAVGELAARSCITAT